MFLKLDHVGVVAHSWEEASGILVVTLGLKVDEGRTPMPEGGYMAPENVRIYFLKAGDGETRIEVLIPQDTISGTAKFLARRGPGLHHLCYAADNVEAEARRLRELGMQQIDLSHGRGDLQAGGGAVFFHPKSSMGILTEIVPYRP